MLQKNVSISHALGEGITVFATGVVDKKIAPTLGQFFYYNLIYTFSFLLNTYIIKAAIKNVII